MKRIAILPALALALVLALGATPARASEAFDRFAAALDKMNASVEAAVGEPFFTEYQEGAAATAVLTAGEVWIAGTREEKRKNLSTIYKMWKAAAGGVPVTVLVIDGEGRAYMAGFDTPGGPPTVTEPAR